MSSLSDDSGTLGTSDLTGDFAVGLPSPSDLRLIASNGELVESGHILTADQWIQVRGRRNASAAGVDLYDEGSASASVNVGLPEAERLAFQTAFRATLQALKQDAGRAE